MNSRRLAQPLLNQLFLLCLYWVLSACSDQQISGGSGTETTNGVQVIQANNEPAVSAQIRYIPKDFFFLDSADRFKFLLRDSTDSLGLFIPPSNIDAYNIWIETPQEAINVAKLSKSLQLTPKVNLTLITSPSDSLRPQQFHILGTDFIQEIQDSVVVFEGIAPGPLSLVGFTQSEFLTQQNYLIQSTQTLEFESPYPQGILLKNFEQSLNLDGTQFDLLDFLPLIHGSYVFSDSAHFRLQGDQWIEHSSDLNDSVIIEGKASDVQILFKDSSLFFSTQLSEDSEGYAGVGFNFAQDSLYQGLNWSEVDTIWIKVRGEGELDFRLEQNQADLKTNSASFPLSLTQEPEWYAIALDEYPEWESLSKEIDRIELQFLSSQNPEVEVQQYLELYQIKLSPIQGLNRLFD